MTRRYLISAGDGTVGVIVRGAGGGQRHGRLPSAPALRKITGGPRRAIIGKGTPMAEQQRQDNPEQAGARVQKNSARAGAENALRSGAAAPLEEATDSVREIT